MGSPPRETERTLTGNGGRLLLIGLVMIVIGLALAIALDRTPAGIGVAIAALGLVPFFGGLGLMLSGIVSRWSRSGKPFA